MLYYSTDIASIFFTFLVFVLKIALIFSFSRPVLFVGPTGTGKTMYIQETLKNGLAKDKYETSIVNFSAQISAGQTQVCKHASQ